MEKPCRKCASKATPTLLFNFSKLSKTAIAPNKLFKNKII